MTTLINTALNELKTQGLVPTAKRTISYVYQHIVFLFHSRSLTVCKKEEDISGVVRLAFDKYLGVLGPKQKEKEVSALMRRVYELQPKTMLEIGTDKGGNLFLLSKVVSPNCNILSIDLPGGRYGGGYAYWRSFLYKRFATQTQSIHLLRRDSQVESSYQHVKHLLQGEKLDLLYIDGDHRYEGAKRDFNLYSSLLSPGGLICFHDIIPNTDDPSIGVPKLWNEIKSDYLHEELIADPKQNQMGIGILVVK